MASRSIQTDYQIVFLKQQKKINLIFDFCGIKKTLFSVLNYNFKKIINYCAGASTGVAGVSVDGVAVSLLFSMAGAGLKLLSIKVL